MKVRGWASHVLLAGTAAVWLTAALAYRTHTKAATPEKVNFSRDVLPILSDKCFKCHGPDSEGRQAGMRLDTPEGAFADRHGQWPIVPGKPKDSLVVQRITSKDAPMPPPSSGKSLSPQQIETLTRWIAQGARYSKLWSFVPVAAHIAVPEVKSGWARNDIDRFVLARLNKAGIQPSPPATRQRWLRRVTLDLTGLPPTAAEIDAFAADQSSTAYDRVVDRLLASPHYGERLAVDWLDAARYSDSYGYQSDLLSPTWPYRDWVVKAFNANLPYNRFIIDNLAGDLLPHATREDRLASAFNRLHRQSNEGGSIPQEFLTEYAVDRVSTFGTAVLGLTLGCARCHDHKFDPITQKEFYQLYAYFNSINEYGLLLSTEIVPTPSMLLPTPSQKATLAGLRRAAAGAQANLAAATAADAGYPAWLAAKPSPVVPGMLARLSLDKVEGGKFPADGPGKASGLPLGKLQPTPGHGGGAVQFDGDDGLAVAGLPAHERWDAFTWSFWMEDPRSPVDEVLLHRTGGTDVGFCGFDLMLQSGYLTARVMRAWPGNAVAVRTVNPIPRNRWTHVAWSYDGSSRAAGLRLYIDGKLAAITVLNDKLWKKIDAYGDLGDSHGEWAFGQRFRDSGFKGGKLDDVAFADRALSPLEVADVAFGGRIAAALADPAAHGAELRAYYASAFDPAVRAARETVKTAQTALTNFEDGILEVEVMQDTPTPMPAYLLARGRYDAPRTPATLVSRGVPKALPPLRCVGTNNRLALARWAVRSDNPLTARVAVNRFWQMLFGVGLVETSENFGVQGSWPTDPALLDYLARRFMDSGWDVKAMLREIVLSATYRQDSALNPRLAAADPLNRLVARGPSKRLTAEMLRDTALAAAGLLNAKVGGPPVNPYQPAGIWTENNTMTPSFVQSKGADLYRRTIYATWKRTAPMPSMVIFDAPEREACSMRRPGTNTPMQALVLLNDVQFVEAARVLAEQVLAAPGADAERIRTAFVRLAGRAPDPTEAAILLETLRDQRKVYAADPKSAAKLIAEGDSKPPANLSPVELAAMTVTVQTVLNSDAVVWNR